MELVSRIIVSLFCISLAQAEIEPILLVHGGAGNVAQSGIPGKVNGMKEAIRLGYQLLIDNKSSLDAVEEAVRSMEDDPNFNAGYGSVQTEDGEVEMDAAIMSGYDLNAGCVAVVRDIKHPISLARLLMEKSQYVFLAGDGTKKFAIAQGVEILPPGSMVANRTRQKSENYPQPKFNKRGVNRHLSTVGNDDAEIYERGTVGAVAIDIYGNISAATSTGGIRGKPHGRIGDSPILGSGTIANNRIAGVSATGDGEFILRFNLAQEILQRIQYRNMSAQEATQDALEKMQVQIGGLAGAITIDHKGEVGVAFISNQMAWGYRKGNLIRYGVNRDEVTEEDATEGDSVSRLQSLAFGGALLPAPYLYRRLYNDL